MSMGCIVILAALLFSTVSVQAHPKVTSSSNNKPSDFVLQETKQWLSRTPPFQNSSSDEEISRSLVDLLSWKAPDYLVKHFPYYFSGLNYEKLPVYILETGKYDIVALMRQGPEVVDNFEKFFVQAIVRGVQTFEDGGLDGKNHKGCVILDFEGFTYAHFTSVAALELLTRLFMQYVAVAGQFLEKVYIINGNYAVDSLYGMLRPIIGRMAERIEMYGPKKSKWLTVLKREFPPDSLPPWYGGSDDFTPIAAYG